MPKAAEDVLIGLLSTSYKLDEQGVASLKEEDGSWKDEAIDLLTQKDAERVATLRGDIDRVKTERYSQGKREALEALEKELRDEFGVKATDARGKDLIKAIIAAKVQGATTLTEEQVKAHPLYLKLEEEYGKVPKTIEEREKAVEERLRAEWKAERDLSTVLNRARQVFKGMNPILSKDEAKAAAQMSLLDNYLKGHKYDLVVDKDGQVTDVVVLKADGSGRLEDAHGHPVKFEALVKEGASKFYDFSEDEGRRGAPNPDRSGRGSSSTGDEGAYDPKTVAAYAELWEQVREKYTDLSERKVQLALLKEAGVRNGVASA